MKLKLTLLALGAGLLMAACNDDVKPDATPEGYVYWTDDGGRVFRVSENGGKVDTLQRNMHDPEGLVMDVQSKKLLLIESVSDSLFTLERGLGKSRSFLISQATTPKLGNINGGIVSDGKGNFWVISSNSWITKGRIGSATVDSMYTINQHAGYALAINNAGTELYWASNDGKIWRANSNGTGNRTVLFSDDRLNKISAIALDEENKHIYFSNYENALFRINMDGSGFTTISTSLPAKYLYALAFDPSKNRLYLGNVQSNIAIYYMETSKPGVIDSITTNRYNNVYGITVY